MSSFSMVKGPATTTVSLAGSMVTVLSLAPSPSANGAQNCSGRMGSWNRLARSAADGAPTLTTSVVSSTALALSMPGTNGLSAAAAPPCSVTMVLMVKAASPAVMGLPSVQTAPDLSQTST